MTSAQALFRRAAIVLTSGAVISVLFSIAVCHTLTALALAALLLSGERLRFPPVKLPLGLFMLGTLAALAFSSDPAAGRPQIRKFFVFLTLLLVASALRERRHLRRVFAACVVVGTASAALGLVQFFEKRQAAAELGRDFYTYYIGERITGLMSHWQTFGGQMMLIFVMLLSFVLCAAEARRRLGVWLLCAVLIGSAIVLGYTRNTWLGAACGALYLLWFWRRWVIALVPIALLAVLLAGPASIRTRVTSAFQPQGDIDSNQHRVVCWRTGFEMIRAHPLLGLGPEGVKQHFDDYVPRDVPRPLPEGWYGHLHNIYLQLAAERGIPTALALFWMLGKMLFDFLRASRRADAGMRWYLHGAIAALIAILVAGMFEVNLGDTEVLTLLLTIAGAGYVMIETAEASRPAT